MNVLSVIAESFKALFSNSVFLASTFTFIISQIIKAIIALFKQKNKSKKEVFIALTWSTGGMPSSHSALVSAMASSTAITEGLASTIFVVTLFFALVIIRDALGVRRAAGLQAKALNNLGRDSSQHLDIEWQPVKEIQGHSPLEVSAGIMLGIVIACVFHFSRLAVFFNVAE